MTADLDARARRVRRRLRSWYRAAGRDLPWRRTRDPYAILVSEVMLQQTQAARVAPAWVAFLSRFPDPPALAAAPRADVLTAWAGLGYNRRAANLHAAAAELVARHGGRVPDDLKALLALPGVGAYTARAVLALAFGARVAPVDTNVARVLARAVAGAPLGRAAVQGLADSLVPARDPGEWTQALMDLGATVCTARAPRCGSCPLRPACAWRSGVARPDPAAASAIRPRPQGAWAGSDRYHRGRLVAALRGGPLAPWQLAGAAGVAAGARLRALTRGLVADGLAEWHEGHLRLPR